MPFQIFCGSSRIQYLKRHDILLKFTFAALLIAATPAAVQTDDFGIKALIGFERTTRDLCGYPGQTVDPAGLAAALAGPLSEAMGLLNTESIIGSF